MTLLIRPINPAYLVLLDLLEYLVEVPFILQEKVLPLQVQ